MLSRKIALLAAVVATTAVASLASQWVVPPTLGTHSWFDHARSVPQVACWPDESAQACWRRAEHRPH
ncbi:hypothetical protein [Chitinibacter tainanensis]|uniref:hypothetical protein n=1 Tax=Chitinibacter tainanensis TaxID=230667 RepID=UPI00040D2E20|nr:hypothetical protein [Chitinibacter tainanensis]